MVGGQLLDRWVGTNVVPSVGVEANRGDVGCLGWQVVSRQPIRLLITASLPEPGIEDPGQAEHQARKGRGWRASVWEGQQGAGLRSEPEDPPLRFVQVVLFSEPGCQGSSREVWEDIADASSWAHVASIRVVRGW